MLIQGRAISTPSSKTLASLVEREESPDSDQTSNIDALVSSPVPLTSASIAQRFNTNTRTPQTGSRIHPSHWEMHPSKIHQSTTKPPQLQLSSHPVNDVTISPSRAISMPTTQNTPCKAQRPQFKPISSPTFDFSFERPESDLSVEAQKIMDSVREEAAKIKAQMRQEQEKQENKDGTTTQMYGVEGRQIAKPKGKSGRYSEVHKQEFKKMDSIANHASTWKNKFPASTESLKRSPSKAGFDERSKPLTQSKSLRSLNNGLSERLENSSPAKRTKRNHDDDTSVSRPTESAQTTPAMSRPFSGLPSAVSTPTKASLARSASVKNIKSSMLPSLTRSISTKTISSPTRPKTEGSNKYLSSLSRFGNVKSILQRSQRKFSNDPAKIAAGTHLPLPQNHIDAEQGVSTSFQGSPPSSPVKRVDFTPNTKAHHELTAASLSPSKIPTAHAKQQDTPSKTASSDPVCYPILADSPNITTRTKSSRTGTPGDFTFRSEKSIEFGSGGFTSPNGTTIRHVRPSGIITPLPTFDTMPAIPHGMPNKKRCRSGLDTPDDENVDPMEMSANQNISNSDDEPRAKKPRMATSPEKTHQSVSPVKRRLGGNGVSKIPKAKDRGRVGLSLGRLNVLARPKERR